MDGQFTLEDLRELGQELGLEGYGFLSSGLENSRVPLQPVENYQQESHLSTLGVPTSLHNAAEDWDKPHQRASLSDTIEQNTPLSYETSTPQSGPGRVGEDAATSYSHEYIESFHTLPGASADAFHTGDGSVGVYGSECQQAPQNYFMMDHSAFIFGSPANFNVPFQPDLGDILMPFELQYPMNMQRQNETGFAGPSDGPVRLPMMQEMAIAEEPTPSFFGANAQQLQVVPPTPAPSPSDSGPNVVHDQHLSTSLSTSFFSEDAHAGEGDTCCYTENKNVGSDTDAPTIQGTSALQYAQHSVLPTPARSPEAHTHQLCGYPPVDPALLSVYSNMDQDEANYGASSHHAMTTYAVPVGYTQAQSSGAAGGSNIVYYAVPQPHPIVANAPALKRKGGNGKGIYDTMKPKDFKCDFPLCEKAFTSRSCLKRHKEDSHEDVKGFYLCPNPVCMKGGHRTTFPKLNGFKRHIEKCDTACLKSACKALGIEFKATIKLSLNQLRRFYGLY